MGITQSTINCEPVSFDNEGNRLVSATAVSFASRMTIATLPPTSNGPISTIAIPTKSDDPDAASFYMTNGMSPADSGTTSSVPLTFTVPAEGEVTFYAYEYGCSLDPIGPIDPIGPVVPVVPGRRLRQEAAGCTPNGPAFMSGSITCGQEVGPVCGNDAVEEGEECDGYDSDNENVLCSDECEILSTTSFECGQGTIDSVTLLLTPGLVDATASWVGTVDAKTMLDVTSTLTGGSASQNGVQETITVQLQKGETEKTLYVYDQPTGALPTDAPLKIGEITCSAAKPGCWNDTIEGDEECDGNEEGIICSAECAILSTTTFECGQGTADSVTVLVTPGLVDTLLSVVTTTDFQTAGQLASGGGWEGSANQNDALKPITVSLQSGETEKTLYLFDIPQQMAGDADLLKVGEITCSAGGPVVEPVSETTIECGESTGTSVSVIIKSNPADKSSNTHSAVSTVDDAKVNNIISRQRIPLSPAIDTAFDNDIWSAAVAAGSSLTWTIETKEAVEFFAYDVWASKEIVLTQVPDMSVTCEPSIPGIFTSSVSGQLNNVNVALSKTTFAEVTITNVGTGSLPLSEETKVLLELSGADAGSFMIATQPDVAELEAGASTSFMVMFSPTTVGKHTATIEILDNTVTIEGTGIYEAISVVSANDIVLPKAEGKYNAGVVSEDAIAVDLSIKSIGGLAVNVVSVSATGSAQISNDLSGTAVAFGESASVLVTLPVTVGETATSVVTIETDSIEMPTRTITISATGAQDSLMFSSASAGVAFSGKTIDAPVAIAGLTTSAVSVKATNPTSETVTIASIALADQAVDGLTLTNGEALIGQTIAAGESVQLDFAFAPTTSSGTASTSVEIGLEDKRSVFTFMVGTTTADLAWAADVESAYALKEGETLSLDFSLPTAPSTDVAPVAFLASGTTMSLVDFELTTTFNGLVGTVDVAITDDDIEEAAETLTLTLATSGRTVTITVAGNDEPEANTELPEEEDVVIEVAGNKPTTAQDDGEEKGSVSVKINKSSTSSGGTVRVVIVEESDEVADYEDPNFEVADSTTTGSSWKTAGVSFAVELSEGVLVDTIEIDAKYSCNANEDELDLFLFDKEVNEWRSAGDYCTAEQYKAPVFDNGKACVATFTVCHLTQFAVVQRQVSGVEDTPTTPTTPNAPSSTVDETASGAGAAGDDDGLSAGWIGVIVTAVGIVLIVGIVLVVVRKKKTGEKTAAGLGGEDSFSSDTESGLSNAGGFSSSASTSASTSASALSSASASSSSALSSGSSGSSSSSDASASASSSNNSSSSSSS